jgi:quercetin dioxygenase-like cupin family protein
MEEADMNYKVETRSSVVALLVALLFAAPASAADMHPQSMGQNVAQMKFGPLPGLPTCALGSVQDGDPGTGPSIIFAKVQQGCVIPWHWHTPNEHLMMVSGTARVEMKDQGEMTLKPGAFAKMPSKHIHQFTCSTGPCRLYVYSDAIFDIHYVDAGGKEIQPAEALKGVHETPGK